MSYDDLPFENKPIKFGFFAWLVLLTIVALIVVGALGLR